MSRTVVAVIDNCPTLVSTSVEKFRTTFHETAYCNDGGGSCVRRWNTNGTADQVFGGWTDTGGAALMWDREADDAESKALQIAREARLSYLDAAEYAAWRAAQEAVVHPGDLAGPDDAFGDACHPAETVPPRSSRLAYYDASGAYGVEPAMALDVLGRHSDTAYAVTRDGSVVTTVVRPCHRDRDTCGALVEAIGTALVALQRAA